MVYNDLLVGMAERTGRELASSAEDIIFGRHPVLARIGSRPTPRISAMKRLRIRVDQLRQRVRDALLVLSGEKYARSDEDDMEE